MQHERMHCGKDVHTLMRHTEDMLYIGNCCLISRREIPTAHKVKQLKTEFIGIKTNDAFKMVQNEVALSVLRFYL